jgi:hypothetical protein
MKRLTQLALAAYPPSWRERYGPELAELVEADDRRVTGDLLMGAARAWLQPAGERTRDARWLSAICTAHVAWCAAFVGTLGYLKQVNDPPLPGLTTGWSQPLWGLEKACFFLGWILLLAGGTALLARIAVPAVRRRDWRVLRPMLPAAVLLVVVLGSIPVVGHFGNQAPAPGAVTVLLLWLAFGLALVIAGAIGPVMSLRRSELPASALRLPLGLAVALTSIACCLAVASLVQAAVLSRDVPVATLVPMWGAVTVMALAAGSAATSVRRAIA